MVENTFGYDATWSPLAGGDIETARVLLNQPTNKESIGEESYLALRPKMEYFDGSFPGLFESVQENNSEVIQIDGQQFLTVRAEKKFDGQTIIITLEQFRYG